MPSSSSLCPAALLAALALASMPIGCGPTYVRGNQVEGLDDAAMSTGIDKRDIEQLLHENLKSLMASSVAKAWANDGSRPTLAIYPLSNQTSEHIDSQLQALLSDIETYMVKTELVTVVSVERQQQMIAEVEMQHGGGFDPDHIAEYNRQLGAKYYITGKVFTSDERTEDERRVQYFMFMQLIEVATSAVAWQNRAAFTKALIQE
ncbi:penicillin-binding protein activator LpoB [Sorangium sp. So ce1182]|uniref:penicillin-binding protein activator LpoB n=1 Tax=Sorangium sp. So ce1182 TaxID=3133334 RepID=UPI003F5E9A8B